MVKQVGPRITDLGTPVNSLSTEGVLKSIHNAVRALSAFHCATAEYMSTAFWHVGFVDRS